MAVQLVETLGTIGRRFPLVGVSDVTLRYIRLMLAILSIIQCEEFLHTLYTWKRSTGIAKNEKRANITVYKWSIIGKSNNDFEDIYIRTDLLTTTH